MQLGRTEIRKRGLVLVETPDVGVLEQHAATAIGLQAVLVRVDDDRVDTCQRIKGQARVVVEFVGKPEVAAVGCVGVYAHIVLTGKLEDGGQWIDGAKPGITHRCNDRADATCTQQRFDVLDLHAPAVIDVDSREVQPEHFANPRVRVVRLLRCDYAFVRMQAAANPQRLEVGHRAAAGQMSQRLIPAEHVPQFDDAFLFERGACHAAIERMIVRVDPQGHRVRNACDRVWRLHHLARIHRVVVGVVVVHANRDGLQHFCRPFLIELGREVGQALEAFGQFGQGAAKQFEFSRIDH